ncbi:MAG: YfhO family protein [Anaerolineae bacterium]|nr:YfhO family protein [Anaerolineae bacterium]
MSFIRRIPADLLSILLLIALCWLFYWRLLTPNPLNQQSLVEGDFSGQFVAFAHYQAVRFAQGEVALWNPYNNGGHPFLADTQSAVFYPPRLITIALLNATGGSTPQRMYDALQKEMVAHALIASLLMYAFVRRLTKNLTLNPSPQAERDFNTAPDSPSSRGERGAGGDVNPLPSVTAGLVAGVAFAYGGYLTGYPQLQLAVMEAGVWLPLASLGIYEATRVASPSLLAERGLGGEVRWFAIAGIALGLSFLAGHPQTSLFFGYMALAYLLWRVASQRQSWRVLVIGALIFGVIGGGLAAVQLIPGWEYTWLTARTALNFDAMGNGFPFYDVFQMLFPGIFSLWSPLYVGIVGLTLAIYAVWRRVNGAIFWIVLAIIALGLSFGQRTIIYDLFYNLVPGFSLFRGQERSAYVIAVSLSVLAGLGTAAILTPVGAGFKPAPTQRFYKWFVWGVVVLAFSLGAALFVNWLTTPSADGKKLGLVTFSLLIAALYAGWYTWVGATRESPLRWQAYGLLALLIFELFSFGRANPNLESKPASERLKTPPLVQTILNDHNGIFRVDGARGVRENFGTLYGVMDIQGISPLRLTTVERLLKLPQERVWELLAVRYVPSEFTAFNLPSTIIAKGEDKAGPINLHKLNNPRPFARLVYKTWIEPNDDAALGILSDPSYDARNTVMLSADPGITLPDKAQDNAQAQVTSFAPEVVTIRTASATPAILSLSLVYYPGWQATIDGQPAPLLRADTALTAIPVPAGDHTVQLVYRPPSYTVGAIISILTLLIIGVFGLVTFVTVRRTASKPADR